MNSTSHPVERFSFSTALFGMLVLTLGMGLGRFLYTPMLPVMLAEGEFSFSELSWIASGNYAGYLAGSLLFSFGAFHLPSRLRPFLLASALATGLLILAMAWLPPFLLVFIIRFLAGVASAGMLIFGSTLIMQHTRHPFVLAALFSGVGVGIALVMNMCWQACILPSLHKRCGKVPEHFLPLYCLLWRCSSRRINTLSASAIGKNRATTHELVVTGDSVWSGGFWLYHRRHLPAAHGERRGPACVDGSPLDTGWLVDCPRLLWLAVGSQTVGSITLPDREFAGAGDLRAVNPRQQLSFITHHQQYWFWRHLYGNDLAGDDHRPPA